MRRTTAAPPAKAAATRPLPDWDKLTFSFSETDVVYRALGEVGREPVWQAGEYLPFGPLELPPAAAFFSYGMGIFEGLKAHMSPAGTVLLFRCEDNARRFRHSAERLAMAAFPVERFTEAVEEVVRRNLRFVPPQGKGSFYLRPMQHGIGPQLGIRPASQFWVLVFGCPVGGYFARGPNGTATKRLRLRIVEQGRSAPGGTGSAKALGNYAGGLIIMQRWKQHGFDDVLYLDAHHMRFLTETSGANVFVKLKSGGLVTPPLDDQILAGITRDSAIVLARRKLGLAVEERPISVEEVLDDGEEVFCTGTAYTVRSVEELGYRERSYRFESFEVQQVILDELLGIQRGERPDPYGWITEL